MLHTVGFKRCSTGVCLLAKAACRFPLQRGVCAVTGQAFCFTMQSHRDRKRLVKCGGKGDRQV